GFRRAVLKLEPDIRREQINFIPDGWFLEYLPGFFDDDSRIGANVFTCVEIEDNNPLSREKLWAYCELWDVLEFYDHGLRLFAFDRYGHNGRQLDLFQMYFAGLAQMPVEPAHARWVADNRTFLDRLKAAWRRYVVVDSAARLIRSPRS